MSDDRTKADKAWEARQEAARYRIFNAATNAAEATDEADDENYFAVLDQAGNAAEAAAAEITGYKTYVATCWRRWTRAANSPSTAHTASVGSCRACCGGSASLPNRTKSFAPERTKF
jgi:hypothetical protein